MKKPAIADMNFKERQELLSLVEKDMAPSSMKEVVIETLGFCNNLLEDLQTSKINISKLRSLLGFHSERLKKLQQVQ